MTGDLGAGAERVWWTPTPASPPMRQNSRRRRLLTLIRVRACPRNASVTREARGGFGGLGGEERANDCENVGADSRARPASSSEKSTLAKLGAASTASCVQDVVLRQRARSDGRRVRRGAPRGTDPSEQREEVEAQHPHVRVYARAVTAIEALREHLQANGQLTGSQGLALRQQA
jgi:hypothetical protein